MYEFQKLLSKGFIKKLNQSSDQACCGKFFKACEDFDKYFIHITENFSQRKSSECFVLDILQAAF